MKKQMIPVLLTALSAAGLLVAAAAPSGTAFTYQGRLGDGGKPASGTYDLRFAVWDDATAGNAIGWLTTTNGVAVSNGLFTVMLDFGSVCSTSALWLEIGVRTNGAAGFSRLAPRQALTASPYALYALNAGTVAAGGLPPGVLLDRQTNVTLSGTFSGMLRNATFVLSNGQVQAISEVDGANNTNSWIVLTTIGGTNTTGVRFQRLATEGPGADIFYAIPHGSDPIGELQVDARGSMAFGAGQGSPPPGNRGIQLGAGWQHPWVYLQAQPMTNTGKFPVTLGCSVALEFGGGTWASNGGFSPAGHGSGYPAWHLMDCDTNGNYKLRWYDNFDHNAHFGATNYSYGNSRARLDILGGPAGTVGGLDMKGRLIQERGTGSAGAALVLDLAGPYLKDYTAVATSITLSTTNANADTTKVERHVYYVRSRGLTVRITYPSGWNTNGNCPMSIGIGKILRLEMESVGLGETNVQVVSASVLADNTYFEDADAQAYSAAVQQRQD